MSEGILLKRFWSKATSIYLIFAITFFISDIFYPFGLNLARTIGPGAKMGLGIIVTISLPIMILIACCKGDVYVVENKIKVIKRIMYGRCQFPLLKNKCIMLSHY